MWLVLSIFSIEDTSIVFRVNKSNTYNKINLLTDGFFIKLNGEL